MKLSDKATEGLAPKQIKRLIHKVAGLPDNANVETYLQGVVDGRDLARGRGSLPFGIKPKKS